VASADAAVDDAPVSTHTPSPPSSPLSTTNTSPAGYAIRIYNNNIHIQCHVKVPPYVKNLACISNFCGNNAKGKIKNAVLNKFKALCSVGQ